MPSNYRYKCKFAKQDECLLHSNDHLVVLLHECRHHVIDGSIELCLQGDRGNVDKLISAQRPRLGNPMLAKSIFATSQALPKGPKGLLRGNFETFQGSWELPGKSTGQISGVPPGYQGLTGEFSDVPPKVPRGPKGSQRCAFHDVLGPPGVPMGSQGTFPTFSKVPRDSMGILYTF